MTIVYCLNTDCKYLDGNVCFCDEITIDSTGDCMEEEDKEDDEEC